VLVTGGGFIGGLTAQWAKIHGAGYVALSEPNKKRGEQLKALGYVDELFDPTEEGAQEKIMLATGGATIKEQGGYDVCFECSGRQSAITIGINTLKKGGRLILIGIAHEPISIELLSVQVKNMRLVGIMGYTPWMFDDSLKMIGNGTFPVLPYLTDRITLDGIQSSFEHLSQPTNADFKIVAYPHGIPAEII
jgi:(R,R)-butanediol dehydrogenase/meso-butanediol dehydrogenase/diacetyl reductase